MNQDQQQRLELIGQLSSGIAHDLNNHLMLVLNHLDYAMQRIPAVQPVRKDLQDARTAAERCTEIISTLLAFGRPTVARLHLADLTIVLAESARMLRRLIPAQIELKVDIAGDLQPVLADETQIQQVILNLAVNARDAMPSGGLLEIGAHNSSGAVHIVMRDNGAGMQPDVLSRIREPYFTTHADSGGTGLGLAMVSRILDEHHAVMEVESTFGKGSCFRISFPCPKIS